MSVINYVTGYHGFTTEPGYGENNGYVKKCIVGIEFPYQGNDVDFFISTGADDWGAKMGDGSIIPLSSPVVIAVGKNNAFIQFDMATGYPSNSPLFLVYRSDTAGMSTTARDTNRSFTASANSATGKFAFTSETGSGPDGYTTKCIATFSFPMQPDEPAFDITTDASHWGLRVGNGTVINLSSPKVLSINREAAVVEFTMATSYPSNSPGIIIMRSSAARYTVVPTAIHEYVAVTNITSPSGSAVLGDLIDLSSCGVEPYNATYKEITWTVVGGSGNIIDNSYAQGAAVGTLKIRGTVKNTSNNTTDFSKDFNITITSNTISIQKQPDSDVTIESGKSGGISITAFANSKVIEYQWYVNTKNSTSGATAIEGENSDELTISSSIGGGVHYFFCKVSAPYTTAVYSIISKVTINVLPSEMKIIPSNPLLLQAKEVQLSIDWVPSDVTDTAVLWKSDNTDVATVDPITGVLYTFEIGTAKITATRVDGKMSATTVVTVQGYKSVTSITDVPTFVYVGETLTLTGTIEPADAVAKTITWSILNNNADATLTGNRLICNDPGTVIVRATVAGGKNEDEEYTEDFTVNCDVRFIPVSDIEISASLDSARFVGDKIIIDPIIAPSNATEQEIEWSIVSGDCIITPDYISLTQGGDLTVRATIENGKGTQDNRSNYTKDFTFTNISQDEYTAVQIAYIGNNNIDPFILNSIYTGIHTDGINMDIIPENASYKEYTCKLVSFMVGTLTDYHGSIDDIDDWKVAPSDIFTFDESTNTFNIVRERLGTLVKYRAEFLITIKNGSSSSGDDFVTTDYLYIDGFPMEPFIPLKDLSIELPSVLRCMTPILLTNYTLDPEFPTIYDRDSGGIPDESIDFMVESTGAPEESAICQIYYYQGIDNGSSGEVALTVVPPEIFKFDLNELYLYPWNVGSFRITVTVKNSTVEDMDNFDKYNPKLVDFTKTYDLSTLPPFIPVKSIKGIPSTIYVNKPVILSPEIDTEGGLNCYNPYWDEEIATYKDITWSIESSSGGVTIEDGVLIATEENVSFTLTANIASGTQEAQKWYDWEDESIDYTESFTINVVSESEDMISVLPFLYIYLENGDVVEVFNINDLVWICNDKPDDFEIIIDNNTFMKGDIVGFKFYDITKEVIKPEGHPGEPPEEPIKPTEPVEPDIEEPIKPTEPDIEYPVEEYVDIPEVGPTSTMWTGGYLADIELDWKNFYVEKFSTYEEALEWYNNEGWIEEKEEAESRFNIAVEEYERVMKQYEIDITEWQLEKEKYDTVYEEYNNKLSEYEVSIEEYEIKYQEYLSNLEEYNKKKEEYDNNHEIDEYDYHEAMKTFFTSHITSLKNFGRNCTSLVSFNDDTMMIPPTVHGDRCLENFLMGCTSFDQKLIYDPYEVDEDTYGMFKYFLRGCTSFNSDIEINIDEIKNGESAFHGFLYGCTSFDKELTVFPTKLYGKASMKRFMYNCTKFNQDIHIPSNLSGNQCLMEFMERCIVFNRDFTLPDDVHATSVKESEGVIEVNGIEYDDFSKWKYWEMNNFMKNCQYFTGTITVPKGTGENAEISEQTLSTVYMEYPLRNEGVTFAGPGAEAFANKFTNTYDVCKPYVHITNLDGLYD